MMYTVEASAPAGAVHVNVTLLPDEDAARLMGGPIAVAWPAVALVLMRSPAEKQDAAPDPARHSARLGIEFAARATTSPKPDGVSAVGCAGVLTPLHAATNPATTIQAKAYVVRRMRAPLLLAGRAKHTLNVRRNNRIIASDMSCDDGEQKPSATATFVAACFLLAGVMTASAQQKPDFSGEWTLNLQASTLSPIVAPVAQSGVLRIEHHEPTFTAHQTIVLDGKPFASNFELLSDGREVVTDAGGRRIVSTLRWDGNALVAAWRIQGPNSEMTISFRYELQDGGRRLRAAEQLRGGSRDQDNVWVFERP
jgi:hypothetical protein